jgi:hypothetical protein
LFFSSRSVKEIRISQNTVEFKHISFKPCSKLPL